MYSLRSATFPAHRRRIVVARRREEQYSADQVDGRWMTLDDAHDTDAANETDDA